MQIITPLIPDPADVVVQGMIIGDYAIESQYNPVPSLLDPVLQGAIIGDKIMNCPTPPLMIGQHENYGVPDKIGPKVFSGGELVMLDIGAGAPQRVYVDKTQEWLMSKLPQDLTGAFFALDADLIGAIEAVNDIILAEANVYSEIIPKSIRQDILKGISKTVTYAKVSPEFCFRCPDRFTDSTFPFQVIVTVRDEAGSVVAGATVYLMQVDPSVTGANTQPITQSLITNANGQGTFWVEYYLVNQLMAYKSGGTPKGGVSLYTSQGGATITLYIKDPTTGGGISIPTVGNHGLVGVA